jgi:hypothetical protein
VLVISSSVAAVAAHTCSAVAAVLAAFVKQQTSSVKETHTRFMSAQVAQEVTTLVMLLTVS